MYPLIFFVIAIASAIVHLLVKRTRYSTKSVIEIFLSYIIPMNIGLSGLVGFIGHTFFGPEVARLIGWPSHNPFQSEIAVANLAMGLAGLVAIWWRQGFWLATSLISGIFTVGAGYVHYTQILIGDFAPYNSGIFLYVGDFLVPLTYMVLSYFYGASAHFFQKSSKR